MSAAMVRGPFREIFEDVKEMKDIYIVRDVRDKYLAQGKILEERRE